MFSNSVIHTRYIRRSFGVILFILLTTSYNLLHAQVPTTAKQTFDPAKETIFTQDTNLVHNIGWVRAPFWDNWYAEVEPGFQLYFGQEDGTGKLKDRISYNGEIYLGRWVFPMVGYRIGFGLGNARGFVTKNTYYAATGNITAGGGGVAYGWGQCDSNYGGYYHNYAGDTSLFIQKWNFSHVQFDVMSNLSYGREYDPRQPWLSWLYFGVSAYFGMSEGYSGSGGTVDAKVDPNRAAEIHIGFIEQYQLSEKWHIYADLRLSAIQRTFDREWIRSIERPLSIADGMFSVHFGVEYNFNWLPEDRRKDWYKSTIDPSFNGQSVPHHVLATQNISYTVVNYMDTIFTYDTINDNSPEYYRRQAEIVKKMAEDSIAAAKQRFEDNCKEATLDDILSKHLLPYEMVFFELDQWDILSSENIKIAKMASLMKSFPDYKFLIIGSADSKTGSVKRNNFLSHNRADVVYNKLVIDYGCDPKQLERVYMGGILDFKPYELNRATVIIMKHPRVMQEFNKLKSRGQAGGSSVSW